MSETKFTPGPWVENNDDGFSRGSIWAGCSPSGAGAVGTLIANVAGDSAEADANAHLIAAAPDLYAALTDAYEVLGAILEDTDGDDGERIPNPLLVQLRAALAKARGEQ